MKGTMKSPNTNRNEKTLTNGRVITTYTGKHSQSVRGEFPSGASFGYTDSINQGQGGESRWSACPHLCIHPGTTMRRSRRFPGFVLLCGAADAVVYYYNT